MPRVLIVDDHDVVRHAVREILEMQNWEVAGEAANGLEAIRLTEELKPDAILMDVTMPGMDGLDATSEITKCNPHANVLILTMHEHSSLLNLAQRYGAKGVLTKARAMNELTPALRAIIAGKTYFR